MNAKIPSAIIATAPRRNHRPQGLINHPDQLPLFRHIAFQRVSIETSNRHISKAPLRAILLNMSVPTNDSSLPQRRIIRRIKRALRNA